MKYATILAVFAAGLVAAQTIDDVPECARPCMSDAAKAANCPEGDFKCMCANRDAVVAGAAACAITNCGAAKVVSEVQPALVALCAKVPTGTTSSAAAPATSSAAAVTSSAAAVTSSAAAVTSSAAAVTSSAADVSSSASSSIVTKVSSVASTAPKPTSNGTTTSAPSSVPTAGAAAAYGLSGFVALALGALAL